VEPAGGPQGLVARTDIKITLLVIDEVGSREGVIVTFALVPDRDVRIDVMLNQPAEHLARPIGDIAGQLKSKTASIRRSR